MTLYLYPCHPSVAWCDKLWGPCWTKNLLAFDWIWCRWEILLAVGSTDSFPKICSEIIKESMITVINLEHRGHHDLLHGIFVVWLSCINSWLERWEDAAQPFNVWKKTSPLELNTCKPAGLPPTRSVNIFSWPSFCAIPRDLGEIWV